MRNLLVLLCAALLASCTSLRPIAATPQDPRSPRVFKGDGSGAASWSELVAAACEADAITSGENHGHPLGLACAAALFEDVLARRDKTSLSLEFFERDEQSRLDDYLAGLCDLATLEKRTNRTAGNFPPGHRKMVETAKAASRPVHASNAPRAYVRTARTDGYEKLRALTAEQQRLFRIPDELFGGRYREEFDKVMAVETHGEGGAAESKPAPTPEQLAAEKERLDHVFRSQSLWDWTMASAIADGLAAGERPVFHVVGRFHVDQRGGLVQALEKLRPGVKVLTISFAAEWSDALKEEDRGRADFVIYVGPMPEAH